MASETNVIRYLQAPYLKVKQPGKYRVIAIPVPKPKVYPKCGDIGEVCWTSSWNGACLNINNEKFIVPFDCIEEANATPIEDAELIAVMLDCPEGVYKLLRGLWRMTKNAKIRNFMERGELPEDGTDLVKRDNRKPDDYNKQWEQAEEAAISGAFSVEIVS